MLNGLLNTKSTKLTNDQYMQKLPRQSLNFVDFKGSMLGKISAENFEIYISFSPEKKRI